MNKEVSKIIKTITDLEKDGPLFSVEMSLKKDFVDGKALYGLIISILLGTKNDDHFLLDNYKCIARAFKGTKKGELAAKAVFQEREDIRQE